MTYWILQDTDMYLAQIWTDLNRFHMSSQNRSIQSNTGKEPTVQTCSRSSYNRKTVRFATKTIHASCRCSGPWALEPVWEIWDRRTRAWRHHKISRSFTWSSLLSFSYNTAKALSILQKRFVSPEQSLLYTGQFLTLLSCSFLGIEQVHNCRIPNIISWQNQSFIAHRCYHFCFFMKTLTMQKRFVLQKPKLWDTGQFLALYYQILSLVFTKC